MKTLLTPKVRVKTKTAPKLPEPDPFIESAPPATYNSTDDLLDIFEKSSRKQHPMDSGLFHSPFTNAPDNLRVESKPPIVKSENEKYKPPFILLSDTHSVSTTACKN